MAKPRNAGVSPWGARTWPVGVGLMAPQLDQRVVGSDPQLYEFRESVLAWVAVAQDGSWSGAGVAPLDGPLGQPSVVVEGSLHAAWRAAEWRRLAPALRRCGCRMRGPWGGSCGGRADGGGRIVRGPSWRGHPADRCGAECQHARPAGLRRACGAAFGSALLGALRGGLPGCLRRPVRSRQGSLCAPLDLGLADRRAVAPQPALVDWRAGCLTRMALCWMAPTRS